MTEFYYLGGPFFMGLLTVILTIIVATALISFIQVQRNSLNRISFTLVKEIGLFGLIVGILGQFIGLYSAFEVIQQSGSVSPEILAEGLKVSSISTIYGIIICLIGYALYFALLTFHTKRSAENS